MSESEQKEQPSNQQDTRNSEKPSEPVNKSAPKVEPPTPQESINLRCNNQKGLKEKISDQID